MCDRPDYWQWHRDPLRPMARRVRRRNDVAPTLLALALATWAFAGLTIGGLAPPLAAVAAALTLLWCWLR